MLAVMMMMMRVVSLVTAAFVFSRRWSTASSLNGTRERSTGLRVRISTRSLAPACTGRPANEGVSHTPSHRRWSTACVMAMVLVTIGTDAAGSLESGCRRLAVIPAIAWTGSSSGGVLENLTASCSGFTTKYSSRSKAKRSAKRPTCEWSARQTLLIVDD